MIHRNFPGAPPPNTPPKHTSTNGLFSLFPKGMRLKECHVSFTGILAKASLSSVEFDLGPAYLQEEIACCS